MTDRKLTRKWLWMQGMEYGCRELLRWADGVDTKDLSWQEELRLQYEYVLTNWCQVLREVRARPSGRSSGYGKYDPGYSDQVRRSGIESTIRHKGISVTVTWAEIKAFIEEMLNPDNQLDMFDLLLKEAKHG